MAKHQYTNDLINETSPYLLQHAHNPVNWMPWGEEALKKAKDENKLLLISIGYAACHWCHVMEHESFEDPEVAKVMNDYYVCIKVDREERPDIDQIYMSAVQLMTQQGGWPLNAVALPDGRPFWGGTYFMKEVWVNTLLKIHAYHQQNPEKTLDYAEKLSQGIKESNLVPIKNEATQLSQEHLELAIKQWQAGWDRELGGRRGAPKFMMPNNLQFILRWAHQASDHEALNFVETTLTKMALGGIYDQVGGGFARYSTDTSWKVPHFEKMLYDNAQLLTVYAQAYQKTGHSLYKEVAEHTTAFLKRELLSDENGFYSSLDADSEGEEGKFYVWNKKELEQLIGNDFDLFSAYFNVNETGHWENGNYILLRTQTDEEFAQDHNLAVAELKQKTNHWKQKLLEIRSKRIRPGLDDKILTSWNAMTISGLVACYRAFEMNDYLNLAEKNVTFINEKLMKPDGSIQHSYKNQTSKIDGFLEDYAFYIQALVDLFEVTGKLHYLTDAQIVADYTFEQFFDREKNIFYFTPKSQTDVINRSIEVHDNVIPASNSVMAIDLFKLGHLAGNTGYMSTAQAMVEKLTADFKNYPSGYSNWMQLAMNLVYNHYETAIIGKGADEKLKAIQTHYLPHVLFCSGQKEAGIPLLKDRLVANKTLIYVCQNNACQLPVENVNEALKTIEQ